MKNHKKHIILTSKEKLFYYSILLQPLIIPIVDFFFYLKSGNAFFWERAPFVYFIVLIWMIAEFLLAKRNLRIETFTISHSIKEFEQALRVMEKERNWSIKKNDGKEILANSYNFHEVWTPVRIVLQTNKETINISSFVEPLYSESWNTWGARRNNIDAFVRALKKVKEGYSIEDITFLNSKEKELKINLESEWTIENIAKRIIAYSIILGFFFAANMYKDSLLFIPMLIFPVIGISYIVFDLKKIILKMKNKTST